MAGRILIADDVATNRIVMKVKLSAAFYEVLQASSAQDALQIATAQRPDLIIMDSQMCTRSGDTLCALLKSNPETAEIPVIVITRINDGRARLQALAAGADEFLTKPLDELTLLARVRSLLRARATSEELRRRQSTARELGFAEAAPQFQRAGHVVIVAREPDEAMRWREQVKKHLRDQIEVMPEVRVLEALQARSDAPDAFVISADLADSGGGLRLLAELRSRENTRHAAILIVHEPRDRNSAVMALDLGANDLLARGFDPEELALRLRSQLRRKIEADRLRMTVEDGFRLAAIDPLTGLYNRRYAMPHMREIARRAHSTGQPFAVLLMDLDRFKVVNDTFGHAAGDRVLVEVAARVRGNLRAIDMAARIGGEEFLVVLPDTDLAQARVAAERMRRLIEQTPIELDGGLPEIGTTVSIGLAIGGHNGMQDATIEQLLEDADQALFGSKADGRNQVTIARSAA